MDTQLNIDTVHHLGDLLVKIAGHSQDPMILQDFGNFGTYFSKASVQDIQLLLEQLANKPGASKGDIFGELGIGTRMTGAVIEVLERAAKAEKAPESVELAAQQNKITAIVQAHGFQSECLTVAGELRAIADYFREHEAFE